MREPGADHKEDWSSGTAAALAGGFTQVLAMPNTQPPVIDQAALEYVLKIASTKAYCDFGQYFGAAEDNVDDIAADADKSAGLKLYLDQTYGPLQLTGMPLWMAHFKSWPKHKPLIAHAEGHSLAAAILMSALTDRPLHLAHVATREEILMVRAAKERGLKITCEVTPHHLWLTESDLPGGRGEVRPRLGTKSDVEALWENMDVIDCIATDHAPHTQAEKDGSEPPPGFPGLETALPLMLEAVHQGRLTLDELIPRMSSNIRRIFGVPEQDQTYVEVDLEAETVITANSMFTKAGWTPFEGWRTHGKVRSVVLRGDTVYKDGQILAQPGIGQPIFQ
jgi:dihydroorotase-like cyclic amidohydrolase